MENMKFNFVEEHSTMHSAKTEDGVHIKTAYFDEEYHSTLDEIIMKYEDEIKEFGIKDDFGHEASVVPKEDVLEWMMKRPGVKYRLFKSGNYLSFRALVKSKEEIEKYGDGVRVWVKSK